MCYPQPVLQLIVSSRRLLFFSPLSLHFYYISVVTVHYCTYTKNSLVVWHVCVHTTLQLKLNRGGEWNMSILGNST